MNNRRKLVGALGASAFAISYGAFGQQQNQVWRVGFLSQGPRPATLSDSYTHGAFLRAMRELGYAEGKNLLMEWRFADNVAERLPELAADLVRSNVKVIVASSSPATRAAQTATSAIPIVMTMIGDPVGSGFIKNLARPGGNVTGLTNMVAELSGKHLEMLRSVTPNLAHLAVLANPDNASNVKTVEYVRQIALGLGLRVIPFQVRSARQIDDAFALMAKQTVQAVLLAQDSTMYEHRQQIGALALRLRLPSMAGAQAFAEAGLLMSYGPNSADIFRRAAIYVDKILKGAKPSALPVEQPIRFDLVVNMRTAKALGIKLPDEIMVRAERLIE